MRPIFIGGCSRSGTTVLGSVLGMHNRCVTVPEAQFKTTLFQEYALQEERFSGYNFLTQLKEEARFKIWDVDLDLAAMSSSSACDHPTRLMEYIVSEYSKRIGQPNPDIWVDHTPLNLAHSAALLNFFPSAKMVHIVRDGRAVASSVIPLDWGPNAIDRAAHWWVESLAHGLSSEAVLNNNQIIRVRYEDLVRYPQQTIRNLCDFLEIDYQPAMLEAAGFKLPNYTATQHALVGKSLNTSRINAWEKKLLRREVEIFERLTGSCLQALGYTPKYGYAAPGISDSESLGLMFKGFARRVTNKFKRRSRTRKATN